MGRANREQYSPIQREHKGSEAVDCMQENGPSKPQKLQDTHGTNEQNIIINIIAFALSQRKLCGAAMFVIIPLPPTPPTLQPPTQQEQC